MNVSLDDKHFSEENIGNLPVGVSANWYSVFDVSSTTYEDKGARILLKKHVDNSDTLVLSSRTLQISINLFTTVIPLFC